MTPQPGTDPLGLGLTQVSSFDIGRYVECDACGSDLTDDTRTGGLIFTSKGYGPYCAERMIANIRGYGEEEYIKATCPPGMAFADWIRGIRASVPHGNEVRIFGSPK